MKKKIEFLSASKSGTQILLIHDENRDQQISRYCPFNVTYVIPTNMLMRLQHLERKRFSKLNLKLLSNFNLQKDLVKISIRFSNRFLFFVMFSVQTSLR